MSYNCQYCDRPFEEEWAVEYHEHLHETNAWEKAYK